MRHWFCCVLWIFLVTPAWAATEIKGSIHWVSDGDTVWLRPDPGQDLGKVRLHKGSVKLRLAAIDAPESCQDWGAEAAAALRIQLKNQPVRAQLLQRDSYGRWLARIYLPQAQDLDVNAWLVAQGHAWDYQFVAGKPGRYAPLQAQAQTAGRGLWSQPSPMQPRQFRREHGACTAPVAAGRPGTAPQRPQPQSQWDALSQWLKAWLHFY